MNEATQSGSECESEWNKGRKTLRTNIIINKLWSSHLWCKFFRRKVKVSLSFSFSLFFCLLFSVLYCMLIVLKQTKTESPDSGMGHDKIPNTKLRVLGLDLNLTWLLHYVQWCSSEFICVNCNEAVSIIQLDRSSFYTACSRREMLRQYFAFTLPSL